MNPHDYITILSISLLVTVLALFIISMRYIRLHSRAEQFAKHMLVELDRLENLAVNLSGWKRVGEWPTRRGAYPVLHGKHGQTFALWEPQKETWTAIDSPHWITHWFDLPPMPPGEEHPLADFLKAKNAD